MRLLVACAAAAVLAGCNTDDAGFNWQQRSAQVPFDPPAICDLFIGELLYVGSSTPTDLPTAFPLNVFRGEQSMIVQYHIRNLSDDTHVLTTGSGPQVIFELVDHNGNVVAGSHLGLAWVQVPVDYPYGADETMIHAWHWDLRMENGRRVPEGNYTLYVDERTQCRDVLSTTRAVRVL